jgi:MFS family permease
MLTGFVTDARQLMGLRFLLGVAEGGVWPAILVIIAKWFPAEERARANALFIMNINIAILLTNPISGWINRTDTMPSAEERDYIVTRIAAEEKAVHSAGVTSYKALFADANLWKLTAFYFFFQVGDIGFMMWLPTITKNLVQQGMTMVGLLSAVPFLAAMAGLYIIAVFSDRSMKRKLFLAIPAIVFVAALFASVQTRDLAIVAYIFLVICGLFHNAYNGVFWGLPPRLFATEVCGGARGLINGIGNLGGFLGPFLVGWVVTSFGDTRWGLYALAGFLMLAFVTALTLPSKRIDGPIGL